MFKKLYTSAIALASFTLAGNLETTEEDRKVACVEYPNEWLKFDLRPLEKDDGKYVQEGIEWNLCDHLPRAHYFASILVQESSGLHTQILTDDDFIPDKTKTIMEDDEVKGV